MKQSTPKTEKADAAKATTSKAKTTKATSAKSTTAKATKKGNPIKRAYEMLFSGDVYFRRIGGFLLWGILLLVISWAVGFFLIKEPIFKGTFLVDKIFGIHGIPSTFGKWGLNHFGKSMHIFKWTVDTEQTFNTWGNVCWLTLKNFVHHLIFVIVFIFGLNLFRVKRFPMGYLFFSLFTVMTGLVVGTNSYLFPPQWSQQIGAVITFIRFGFWAWFAYGLLAVSTLNWGWLSSSSVVSGDWQKLRPFWPIHFANRDDREVFIYGLLFLLAASFAEARLIVHYGYHLIF